MTKGAWVFVVLIFLAFFVEGIYHGNERNRAKIKAYDLGYQDGFHAGRIQGMQEA